MIYGSVCSGIEAASVAWHPLGWRAAFFSEIAQFPRAVLKHHFPAVPLHGDFSTIEEGQYAAIDLLVGGTPCQSFSIAGLRAGLDDARGNLALEFCLLARRLRPRWVVWENVSGVLSLDGGRAFAAILGGLAECGYGLVYRVLDAQYVRVDGFGRAVPQRRRRVFVVGHSGGEWRRAAAVLFDRASLSSDTPPCRKAGETVAGTFTARTRGGGGLGTDFECDDGTVGYTLNGKAASRPIDAESETLLPVCFDPNQITSTSNRSNPKPGDPSHTLVNSSIAPAIAFNARQDPDSGCVTGPLDTDGGSVGITHQWVVRRLMPVECERLQGFPDGWTAVPYRRRQTAADGPRYAALGNSMAVNVMRWIGRRIEMVDAVTSEGRT